MSYVAVQGLLHRLAFFRKFQSRWLHLHHSVRWHLHRALVSRAGIATSLKVLFSADDCSGALSGQPLQLERNEVIAMLNLLERLSASIEVGQLTIQLVGIERHAGLGPNPAVVGFLVCHAQTMQHLGMGNSSVCPLIGLE